MSSDESSAPPSSAPDHHSEKDGDVAALQKEIEDLKSSKEELREKAKRLIGEAKAKVVVLEKKVEELTKENEDLRTKSPAPGDSPAPPSVCDSATETDPVNEPRENSAQFEKRIEELEAENQKLESRIDKAKEMLRDINKEKKELESGLAEAKQHNHTLSVQLQEAMQTSKQAKSDLTKTLLQVQDLETDRKDLSQRVEELEAQLAEVERASAGGRSSLHALETKLRKSAQDLTSVLRQIRGSVYTQITVLDPQFVEPSRPATDHEKETERGMGGILEESSLLMNELRDAVEVLAASIGKAKNASIVKNREADDLSSRLAMILTYFNGAIKDPAVLCRVLYENVTWCLIKRPDSPPFYGLSLDASSGQLLIDHSVDSTQTDSPASSIWVQEEELKRRIEGDNSPSEVGNPPILQELLRSEIYRSANMKP